MTNLLIEEETVGKVTAVPDFSTASRNRNQSRKQPIGSPDQDDVDDDDDDDDDDDEAVEEELKSPTKIRKVVRSNNKGKGATSNKIIKTKSSRITLHRNSKSAPVEDDGGDKFDDLMEDEEEEEDDEEREGLIELDGEEEAAFANLGMHGSICSI